MPEMQVDFITISFDSEPKQQLPASQKSLTSIIIPTLSNLKLTKNCVESIIKHTKEFHEILLVDNGSTGDTAKWLRLISKENPQYKIIESKSSSSFCQALNQGIMASSGEYIVLLDNDAVVAKDWLSGLLQCLNSSPDTGIVGAVTEGMAGPDQSDHGDGASTTDLEEFAQSFRERSRFRRIPANRVPGFCMLFRRELVEKIGLLDENCRTRKDSFDEYCLRAVLEEYSNLIAGDVFISRQEAQNSAEKGVADYSFSITYTGIFEEKMRAADPKTPDGKNLIVLKALELSSQYYQKGDVDKSVETYLKGLKHSPLDSRLYYGLAETLLDAKQFKDALDVLQEMESGDEDEKKQVLIGYCRDGMELFDEAEEHADLALSINDSSAIAMNLKGILAYKKGDVNAAEKFFLKAIDSDPGYGEPYTNLGVMKWTDEQKEAALDLLERGFILSPAVTDILTLYHSAIAQLGEYARAEQMFLEASLLHPYNERLKHLLIDIYIQQSKHHEAMREVEEAMTRFDIDDGLLAAALELRKKFGAMEVTPNPEGKGTLSLCMIVKNEERYLPKCLMSVKPIVDEMILVDTGSDDRTKDIARALGAKVYDYQWTNDFAEARNVSLSEASGDWIFVLDADEVISPLDYDRLRRIFEKKVKKPAAYSITTRNYIDTPTYFGWTANDGVYSKEEASTGWIPSTKTRLFTNDPRIRFDNPVHEFIEYSLMKLKVKIKKLSVPVHHYGKLNIKRTSSKDDAYYQLGKTKLERDKNNLKAMSELAIQAAGMKKYDEAIDLWKKVLEVKPNDIKAFINLSHIYVQTGDYEDAIRVSKKAVEIDPTIKEAALNYSSALFHSGNFRKSISVLENLLESEPNYPPAMGLFAMALYLTDEKERALDYVGKINSMGYNIAEFLLKNANSFLSIDDTANAVSVLELAVESDNKNKSILSLLRNCYKNLDIRNPKYRSGGHSNDKQA